MASGPFAFGIDFGTTNTRIAFYDGRSLRMIPLADEYGQSFGMPTRVAYRDGRPSAFGYAATLPGRGASPGGPIKWLLDREDPVEVDGRPMEPVRMVSDFFAHLKGLVAKALPSAPMDRAAITIPVNFPSLARRNLLQACGLAGVEITHVFFEPVAALYCDLFARPASGVAAVFDWGGGSLDIATVAIRDRVAWTRRVEGWHKGGEHFDEMIARQALEGFLRSHPDLPQTAGDILATPRGRTILRQAELAKIEASGGSEGSIEFAGLVGSADLEFRLSPEDFDGWIEPAVAEAANRLRRAIRETGITPGLLSRLILSGGTCNIPAVKERLAGLVGGDRLVTSIAFPPPMLTHPGGMDELGNATAIGAALLAVHGARPMFANDVGVRLAHAWDDHDAFFAVFEAETELDFTPRRRRFFISNASEEVARLLICDRPNAETKPQGRLLRVIPVPIAREENWLDVEIQVDRHLMLRVSASGRVARAVEVEPTWIPELNLGFRLPERPPTEVVR